MRTYLWTMLILLVLETIGRAIWIGSGKYPERTPGATVFDLIAGLLIAGLLIAGWTAFLLMDVAHG